MKKVTITGYMSDNFAEKIGDYLKSACAEIEVKTEDVKLEVKESTTKRVITSGALTEVIMNNATNPVVRPTKGCAGNILTGRHNGAISETFSYDVYETGTDEGNALYNNELSKGFSGRNIYELVETNIPNVYTVNNITDAETEDKASKDISGYFRTLIISEEKDYKKILETSLKVAKNRKHAMTAISNTLSYYSSKTLAGVPEEESKCIVQALKNILINSSMDYYDLLYNLRHFYSRFDRVLGKEVSRDLLCDFFLDRYPYISKETIKTSELKRRPRSLNDISLDEFIIRPTDELWSRPGTPAHASSIRRDCITKTAERICEVMKDIDCESDEYNEKVIELAKGYGRLLSKIVLPNEGSYSASSLYSSIEKCDNERGNSFIDFYLLSLEMYATNKVIKETVSVYLEPDKLNSPFICGSTAFHRITGKKSVNNISSIGFKVPKMKKAIMESKLGKTSK